MIAGVLLLRTSGFIAQLNPEQQAKIMQYTLKRINQKTDMIVIYPTKEVEKKGEVYDDNGRTLITDMDIPKKVYAKLDDFGDAETLSENAGFKVNTQYAITFMLAEEY